MIRCDYCGKEVKARQSFAHIEPTPSVSLHYHADGDRLDGDCIGQIAVAISAITGTRPEPKATT
jgi:hypothetical protein